MTNATPPPPGWYLDPSDSAVTRWWDGTVWTAHAAPLQQGNTPAPAAGKSMLAAYLFILFLGGFGAHRYYLGRPVSASILLIVTLIAVVTGAASDSGTSPVLVIVWIWMIVDLFLIPSMVRSTRSTAP